MPTVMLGVGQFTSSIRRQSGTPVSNWATDFENLLKDPAGLRVFTEFLKREFSEENIAFWTAAEQYRQLRDKEEMKSLAEKIYTRYLGIGATEPVNVDSTARQTAKDGLRRSNPEIFQPAQKQIFNLMKFDSYQRFLKSELYSECLAAEKCGRPLPLQETKTQKSRRGRSKSRDRIKHTEKIKESREDSEEKKRKSLLPWQKGKDKNTDADGEGRSRDRNSNMRGSMKKKKKEVNKTSSCESGDSDSREVSGMCSRQSSEETCSSLELASFPSPEEDDGSSLCRVILPDYSTVVKAEPEETVGSLVYKLIERRGLRYSAVDVYGSDSDKCIDHTAKVSSLEDKELRVEPMILFRLELPCKKIIAIKSAKDRCCGEALEPILRRYRYEPEDLTLTVASSHKILMTNVPVSMLDCQKVVVQKKDAEGVEMRCRKSTERHHQVSSQVFMDISKGRSSLQFDALGVLDLEHIFGREVESKMPPEDISDYLSRRNSLNLSKDGKGKSLYSARASIHEGMAGRIQATEKAIQQISSVSKSVHYRETADISQVWNRTQSRIDDQRGTEINCELPEFLKPKDETPDQKLATNNSKDKNNNKKNIPVVTVVI